MAGITQSAAAAGDSDPVLVSRAAAGDVRAFEELSAEETATVLDIPPATVRTRLFRARSLLREALAQKIDLACDDAFSFAGERCDRVVASVLVRLNQPKETS